MERREFLKVAAGFAAGAMALASAAKAAPLMPQPDTSNAKGEADAKPAVADQHDLDNARIEDVRWGRRRGWGRRRWGFRRRRFWGYRRHRRFFWHRRRFWGFRRRHWRRWHRRRYW